MRHSLKLFLTSSSLLGVLNDRSRHIDRLTFEVNLEIYKIYALQTCKSA